MSSKKYAAPLLLEVSSSRFLLILLFSLHLLSLVLLLLMPLSIFFVISGALVILTSTVYTILYHAFKNLPSSITDLIWDIEDEWFLFQKDGSKIAVALDGNSFVHPWFAVLNFQQENKLFSRSVVLLSDNVNKNDFRRLRVRLKVTSMNADLNEAK